MSKVEKIKWQNNAYVEVLADTKKINYSLASTSN
jgi:hypothetical protein